MTSYTHTDSDNQLSLADLGISVPQIESVPHLPHAKKGTAASLGIRYKDFGAMTLADYEVFSQLPEHPFWSQVERLVDFTFADELCAHLYSPQGQRPYAPSLKLKLHLVQAMENLSDRELEVRLTFDMAIKRFIGVPLSFKGLDHSTLGLDRERMGDGLFHACFHYILAQAKAHGLWGQSTDVWLVDSFHTLARASHMGALRLVKQGMLNIVQHLKRTHASLYASFTKELHVASWFESLPKPNTPEEEAAAASLLIVRAYTLLNWFEKGHAHTLFWQWNQKEQQLRSLELQAVLYLILQQNTRPTPDGTSPEDTYEKIPRKERPGDRIVNAHFPDLRKGKKTSRLVFTGDKIQVVESSASGLILEIEPIPGNEHDGQRLPELMASITKHHETTPAYAAADSAYGYGTYRSRVKEASYPLVTPIVVAPNSDGLWGKEKFHYEAEQDRFICPTNQATYRKARNNKEEGYQYFFKKSVCASCTMKAACTKSQRGRSIFLSDHEELVKEAKSFSESEEGKAILRQRWKIERTNNELANHHLLRRPYTRNRDALRIQTKLKATLLNIKIFVKKLGCYREDPFVRQKQRQRGAAACTS
jgi:hypothetical protein